MTAARAPANLLLPGVAPRWTDARLGRWSRTNRLIAEAAARAGATVEELCDVHTDALLALRRGEKRVIVAKTRSPFLSAVANKLANNKYASGRILAGAGLPVVPRVLVESLAETAQLAAAKGALAGWGTVVVKPNWGNRALAITKGVRDLRTLKRAVRVALENDEDEEALIEPELSGRSLRVSVIGGEVVGACVVERPLLVGDGVASVAQRIAALNRDPRRGVAWEGGAPTALDRVEPDDAWIATLKARGLAFDAPIPEGVTIEVLPEEAETIDVTDTLHPRWADAAVRACATLGVDVGGVDFVVADPASAEGGALLEVNCLPALHLHALPTQGKPRPVFDAFVAWCLR